MAWPMFSGTKPVMYRFVIALLAGCAWSLIQRTQASAENQKIHCLFNIQAAEKKKKDKKKP